MNGAHRLQQKGAIHFDEAAIVNLTAVVPGGPQGKRTAAVGSHLDLAPTLLEFAGLSQEQIAARFPHLKGRSLKNVDRKSTRLNSSHANISYAVFCLKKKMRK